MIKKVICLFFTLSLLGITSSFSQKNEKEVIDSILSILPKLAEDTTKINAHNAIAFNYYLLSLSQKSIEHANKALKLSQDIHWEKGIANAYNILGANNIDLGKFELSEIYFIKSIELFEKLRNKIKLAQVNYNAGILYRTQNNVPKAMVSFLKASRYAEEVHDTEMIADCYNNLGRFYLMFKDYPSCLKYFGLGYRLLINTGSTSMIRVLLSNLAVSFQRNNQLDSALIYNEKALRIAMLRGENDAIANLYGNASLIYSKSKNYDYALNYGFESLKISEEIKGAQLIAWAKFEVGNALLFLSNVSHQPGTINDSIKTKFKIPNEKLPCLKLSLKFLQESAIAAQTLNDQTLLRYVYEGLIQVNRRLNNLDDALNFADKLRVIEDSVFSSDKAKQMLNSEFQNLIEKNRITDSLATQEIRKQTEQRLQKQRNYTLIGVSVAILLVLFSIYEIRKNRIISNEKNKSEQLLLNILPQDIAKELKEKGKAEAKQYDHVTVLFTDFVNFTGIGEKLSPTDLVEAIHKNFMAFDAIIEKYGLEKIKTIGDAYLAVCGLPNKTTDHAERVLNAAVDIRDYMLTADTPFGIRIGIHSGPVVAGIVGVKKYAFDIWGDTVNTASRMESHGESGRINTSSSTFELIKEKFTCTYRGKISVKGKGDVDMYFVDHPI